ncbi:MAG: hypothetical protein ABSG67_02595 [Thermoguttaceae bacterium]|jgi:hypothetical protein
MFTRSIASLAFLVSCLVASSVLAQCGCGYATTAYYAPAYTSFYAPTAAYYAPYTSYYAPAPYTSYYAPAYTSYYAPPAAYYPVPYRAYYAPSAYYYPRYYVRPFVRWW